MHYIRLLRPPSLVEGKQTVLSFVLTITTDLGDSFYSPDGPRGISVRLETETRLNEPAVAASSDGSSPSDSATNQYSDVMPPSRKRKRAGSEELSGSGEAVETTAARTEEHFFQIDCPAKQASSGKTQSLAWSSGTRVLKMGLVVPQEAVARLRDPLVVRRRICFSMLDRRLSIVSATDVITTGSYSVVPLWVDVPATDSEAFRHVAVRRLCIGHDDRQPEKRPIWVEEEEEVGESIARHIWDAGLATVAFVADTCMGSSRGRTEEEQDGLAGYLRRLLATKPGRLHVLELGSGVGILGIGLATILGHVRRGGPDEQDEQDGISVLLTDLPEAEERATANMQRATVPAQVRLDYENLDWDEGCQGRFGAKVAGGRPWDLVVLSDCTYNVDMLPALVQTLSALQAAASTGVRVLLARKPRHADEEALFGLLAGEGWQLSASSTMALPGGKEELELYLYGR
ncbi:hypothetical protein CMQ_7714 [Grosmannia clavigera kw1407]|uniref:Uncharacterized protein n=1 Tax=Grosmannia clavigera (strain kw1407 / UAMH 11150) TaxID=655863 RepID=F0XQH8_GROCL|nr:uncharacterized protein CMQ_7714 [Grosmannia clavigera kw1407]EFX00712.1 hypothetical protein CMQ_7714 [Grosmannia clavigera kw1407]